MANKTEDHSALVNAMVACIDLLGMSKKVQNIRLPVSNIDEKQAYDDIKKAFAPVLMIEKIINNKKDYYFDREGALALSDVEKTNLRDIFRYVLNKHNMSDSWYLWVTFVNNTVPEYAILMFLETLSEVICTSLATGNPIRGGISFGPLIENKDIGPYGPALMNAHILESKCADYPRIVVEKKFIDMLRNSSVANHTAGNNIDATRIKLSKHIMTLLFQDDDGFYCLDYLHLFSAIPDVGKTMYESIIKSARKSYQEFIDNSDYKLALKYSRLLNYLEKNEKNIEKAGDPPLSPPYE